MTIRWLEGFDWYHILTPGSDTKYDFITASQPATFFTGWTTGRFGKGGALKAATDIVFGIPLFPSLERKCVTGAAFKFPTFSEMKLLVFVDGSRNEQCSLWVNADGRMSVRRGSFTLGVTEQKLIANQYTYIEIWTDTHTSQGFAQVRFDGAEVLMLDILNTANTGSSGTRAVHMNLESVVVINSIEVDDWYVSAGLLIDDQPLGDLIIETRIAESVDENTWDTTDANIPGELDDLDIPDGVTYVHTDTDNEECILFLEKFRQIREGIPGVMFECAAARSAAGTDTFNFMSKIASVKDYGAVQTVNTTAYDHHVEVLDLEPTSSKPWTKDHLEAGSFGMRFID